MSVDSRILIEPYSISLDPRISIGEFNELVSVSTLDEKTLNNQTVDDSTCNFSTPAPLCFKRFLRHVSSKRFEYMTFEHQLLIDSAKTCCLANYLPKFGKKSLKEVRLWYLSLNGDEQDTFLADRLQLIQEYSSGKKVSFEYYLTLNENVVETLSR